MITLGPRPSARCDGERSLGRSSGYGLAVSQAKRRVDIHVAGTSRQLRAGRAMWLGTVHQLDQALVADRAVGSFFVDTYGGLARHGGGVFSGKDGTKSHRAGVYAARQSALTAAEAGLAEACEVRLAYAIGVAGPVALHLDLSGGLGFELDAVEVAGLLDALRPRAIIDRLALTSAGFLPTAAFGHFGRLDFARDRLATNPMLGQTRRNPANS